MTPQSNRVQHHDNPWRLLVRSDSDPSLSYLVDLESFDGNGECDCEDFQIRHRPVLEKGKRLCSRCKHITLASKEFNRWIIPHLHGPKQPDLPATDPF